MRTILFHSNHMGIRGSEVALHDYAYFNQTILGNRSIIAYDRNHADNHVEVVAKFQQSFGVHAYDDFKQVEGLIARERCDGFYAIKWGFKDGTVSRAVPNMIHAVFATPPEEAHGEAFAYISEWLAKEAGGGFPFVPHMIHLPDHNKTLRAKLNIPKNAFVFGSYGGHDSFDVPFAPACVAAALGRRSDLYFLFMNYPKFLAHERALFFQGSANGEFKTAFINSCDAMLHARMRGETFGLACGEFSSRNKPVLTWNGSPERGHIEILGAQALTYDGADDLTERLCTLDKSFVAGGFWRAYGEKFPPAEVMRTFEAIFLAPTAP
jgi:hypothetical protein